ncbi:thiopeptide-type bacteriocin biosynthesis domain-containing protein [Chitinophaga rupis]|uniref:Thiopeptide-type bacteriocin biosynthesis domain-containing protein n=1 Tax=Chitinophaga rupis TaxID=573321 RepID=A0A1H8JSR0_9BACT|nr:lantibiotic dehydratase [Chitinophaga rupis]SEN83774.1 thiopeptide-type bacteriocin biosynthesis domain-containing protein [Chitinophaga rupis]
MNIPYSFHKNLVLRTPRLPLFRHLDEKVLLAQLDNAVFLEAVYLASPVLYDECMKWKNGHVKGEKEQQKLLRSLMKYFTRMSSRCTPFGLFSGCNLVQWQAAPTAVTVDAAVTHRHTRLDMHYLCALAQQLATLPGIKEHLLYYPNSSIYTMGDETRYVEYRYVAGRRKHQISAVNVSVYLDALLQQAKAGVTITAMLAQLVSEEISAEEAGAFIDDVIQAQMLVNELEPAITGDEFIYQIIRVLQRIQAAHPQDTVAAITGVLQQVNTQLQAIDSSAANTAENYRSISALLDQLGVPYEENKLFQTDIIKIAPQTGVQEALQQQLLEGLSILNRLAAPKEQGNLASFSRRFSERYEEKEMPLLEVLDTETGIGYLAKDGNDNTPLLDNIAPPSPKNAENNIKWGRVERYLANKVNQAYQGNAYAIDIQEKELEHLDNKDWNDLPPSMSIMFRLIDAEKQELYLDHAYGPSAANILGRFAHADEGINNMVCDITRAEQEKDPNVVYAEIIHLPESRVGNILLRPVFREYEIPYLAKSALDMEHQIAVDDLVVSVKNGKILLRSKRLNKVVIPRLSTAHNYSFNSLPVYHFLCDLQRQQLRSGLSFSWGSLVHQYKFLPRVAYKNTILSLANWRFLKSDYEHLLQAPEQQLMEKVQAFRQQWHMPRYIVLADGDNEMLVDLENEILVKLWLDTIKNRGNQELKEFLVPQSGITDPQGNVYTNQLVAVLTKQTASYGITAADRTPAATQPTRSFSIGSEWLYYKFYCGIKTADRILTDAIYPVVKQLLGEQAIDKFFFIRYNDPEFHIRVRFHLTDLSQLGKVIGLLHQHIRPFEEQGYIWKTQTDIYSRELERYGNHSIEQAETLFFHDSMAVLEMLENTWGDERDEIRWLWVLRAIDELLDGFGYTLEGKQQLAEILKDSFAAEFNADKLLKTQLNNKYRENRKEIEEIMDRQHDAGSVLQPILVLLQEKNRQLQPVIAQLLEKQQAGTLERSLNDLLFSYIHMLVNRTITSKPRVHEMVVYDLLHQYYRSLLARQKNKGEKKQIAKAA